MDVQLEKSGSLFAYASNDLNSGRYTAENRQNSDDSVASTANDPTIKVTESTKVAETEADNLIEGSESILDNAVAEVSEFINAQNRQLNFDYDDSSNRSVIKVTDSESGEIIRQIPSEEMLKLAQRISELRSDAGEAIGVLINREV
ncbi:flagellar protein FlaG [Catenovulum agarivorans]|uniref:flagellar protein FlaG n=1 Tax=Catenovulum agarivorans TaxID=1172192 RepID=UPI0002EF2D90|nr:flagellar protein FlaG [Catenovulum agarivorans]